MIHQYRIAISIQEVNLERTLRSGQTFRWKKDDWGIWQGADGNAWFYLRQTEDSIDVSSNVDEPTTRLYLDLDRSFADFAAHVAAHGSELSPMLSGMQGLRVLNATGTLETVFTFLCSGNNSLHRIIPMAGYLGGKGSLWPNGAYRFPDLDQLLEVTEAELRSAGFGYRAKFIVQSAARMRDQGGEKWLYQLRNATYDQAWPELTSLPGIGRKIADCICLFGLGHQDAVPIDTHLWQQLTRLYHPDLVGESLTASRYEYVSRAFRDRFGPVAGWAHQFLFEDNVVNGRSRRADRTSSDVR